MGHIVVSEFLTLDGVMQDPGGAEGFDRGGWAFLFERGPKGDKFKMDELMEAEAFLLGRRTYEDFAAAWPSRTGEFADRMNRLPKRVVSTTLKQPTWQNTRVIGSDPMREIARLRAETPGNILVAGSAQLVDALIQNDLVDELRLMVFPIILGAGKRLFQEGSQRKPLQLVESQAVGAGVLALVYRADEKK